MVNELCIVMYHYVRDLKHSRYPKIKGLDVNIFRQQIDYFKQKFSVVTMEEVLCAAKGKGQLPANAVLLTFDDGYIDNYTYVLPILDAAGVQGSFFIPGKILDSHELLDVNKIHYILASTDSQKLMQALCERMDYYRGQEYDYPQNNELFEMYAKENRWDCKEIMFIKRILQTVLPEELRNQISSELFADFVGISEEKLAYELYMTEEQIRYMKKGGMFIGIHGYDHYWLGNMPTERMQQDVDKSLAVMDEFIDKKSWVMNYPRGNYNDEVLSYISAKGCVLGCTTEVAVADLSKHNLLTLPRLDCNDFLPERMLEH